MLSLLLTGIMSCRTGAIIANVWSCHYYVLDALQALSNPFKSFWARKKFDYTLISEHTVNISELMLLNLFWIFCWDVTAHLLLFLILLQICLLISEKHPLLTNFLVTSAVFTLGLIDNALLPISLLMCGITPRHLTYFRCILHSLWHYFTHTSICSHITEGSGRFM